MKSRINLLIQLSLTMIFVLSGYSYCNAGNKTEIKSEKIVNDTNMCLLDSLNIDSIYIRVVYDKDILIKGNNVYVDPLYRQRCEFDISKSEVDSLIMPLNSLYINKTVPVRLGRKKNKSIAYSYLDNATWVEIKIFTPGKVIKVNEEFGYEPDSYYTTIYSEEFNKFMHYIWDLSDFNLRRKSMKPL